MKKQDMIVYTHLICIVIAAVVFSASPASGQMLIQPMRIDLTPRPGRPTKASFEIQNFDQSESQIINLRLVDLSQWPDGTWRVIEPNDDFDRSRLSSCKDWTRLEKTRVEVKAMRISPVNLTLRVPSRTRGFYGAGIIAETEQPPDATGVSLIIQFLVPVILDVQVGRSQRHKVELQDVGMSFSEPNGLKPATAMLSVDIENKGGTFSGLKVFGRVRGFSGGHWRDITKVEFKDAGIIPGVKLSLESDIGRSLPSGQYKVAAGLYVDGMRVRVIEKTMNFAGDPTIAKAASDVALTVTPAEAVIKAMPGATRTTLVRVRNDSDETVNVRTNLTVPPGLHGLAVGDLLGDELDCSGWLKMMPEQFQLRPGGRQNIRVTAKMPKDSNTHACYYALLSLYATYPDGQNAGTKTSYVCVTNNTIEAVPIVQPLRLTVSEMEESRHFIVARFANYGDIHYTPRCSAKITQALTGYSMGRPILLSSSRLGTMLPFEHRTFSGIVDLKSYPAGMYYVTASLAYAPGEETPYQIPIRVSIEGDRRVVDIIQPERPGEKIGIELNR